MDKGPPSTLDADGLVKRFEGRTVVDGLGFACHPGEIFSLLGPNGAGKTTTVKMLYGLFPPDGGTIRYGGLDLAHHRHEIKSRIGVCSQNDTLDYDLDVIGNLTVFGRYYHMDPREALARAVELLGRFELAEYRDRGPRTLSGGMRRRLQIARALMNRPDVLFLDEPTTGLDPHARRELWDVLHGLKVSGITIVLTTHYMDEAETLSDRVLILDEGRKIEEGFPRAIIDRHFPGWILDIPDTPVNVSMLAELGMEHVAGYGRLVVHAGVDELSSLMARLDGGEIIRRRPNLEDLFLKLTGRGLSEKGKKTG